jgi:hypothetical protein
MVHRRPTQSRQEIVDLVQSLVQGKSDLVEAMGMTKTTAEWWNADGKLEGRAEQARKIILRLGSKWLGAADTSATAQLDAIADVDRLERMLDRLDSASSWEDVLATP